MVLKRFTMAIPPHNTRAWWNLPKNMIWRYSAGTDLHDTTGNAGIEMPEQQWEQFRNTLFASPTLNGKSSIENIDTPVDQPVKQIRE